MQLKLQEGPAGTQKNTLFADVIVPFPLFKAFTYRIPEEFREEAGIGKRAVIQFGKKRILTSIIEKIHTRPPEDYRAKSLIGILDREPVVNKIQIEFWHWMADYYCAPVGDVMAAALPSHLKLQSETRILLNPDGNFEIDELNDKEFLVVEALEVKEELVVSDLEKILHQKVVFPVIKSLHEKGVILIREELIKSYKPRKEGFIRWHPEVEKNEEKKKQVFDTLEKAPRQLEILMNYVTLSRKNPWVIKKDLLKQSNATAASLKKLVEKEIFIEEKFQVDRLPEIESATRNFELFDWQQEALNKTEDYFKEGKVVLLHGITGSGKTHIYQKLIEKVIQEGKQALYLVPEIALTAQLIKRLKSYFGKKVGIYHSKFNPDERVEIWNKVLDGSYQVVLGVRSSIFLPFKNLGMIVVDEEHETTFKQLEPSPYYHARDAAIYLAGMSNANILLGTGTPSFESYMNARNGKYGLVELGKRFGDIRPPELLLSDLKEEYRKKRMKSHLSSQLFQTMQNILSNDGQVILFQNRRGYSPFLECEVCANVPQCINCDISLTYHKYFREVKCHYCGYSEPVPSTCKACGSPKLKMMGFGTEKIEDELAILFPEYKILRLDQDTTKRKKSYSRIITEFETGRAQILVGTQMVTKGLDFENVKLVGVLNADQMLKFPDFRANERSFQLMLQVSGRAGRRKERGKVIIQTFSPSHPIFNYLNSGDFKGFFEHELPERLKFKYPPFYRLIRITLKDKDPDKVKTGGNILTNRLREKFGKRVLGPEMPVVPRIRNKYIINILLKFEKKNFNLREGKSHLMTIIHKFSAEGNHKSIRVIVDVDPY